MISLESFKSDHCGVCVNKTIETIILSHSRRNENILLWASRKILILSRHELPMPAKGALTHLSNFTCYCPFYSKSYLMSNKARNLRNHCYPHERPTPVQTTATIAPPLNWHYHYLRDHQKFHICNHTGFWGCWCMWVVKEACSGLFCLPVETTEREMECVRVHCHPTTRDPHGT